MNRKSFLKRGTAGLFSTIGLKAPGSERKQGSFDQQIGSGPRPRKEVITGNAMICASHPLAVAVGYDVLKAGGNAVDAAIAANAMLCLTEPMMCGLGGDLFAMVWSDADRKLYGLNASGRSPYNWSLDQARNMGLKSIPSFGPLSWSVPGCVSGWTQLLRRFGNKSLGELLAPTISYARNGFPVSDIIADDWEPENGVTDYATLNDVYLFNGKGLRAGDVFRNPDLAHTLEILSRDGGGSFYEGEIADRIVKFSRKHNGRFGIKDFNDHAATWVDPVTTTYRDYQVWQLPPNGQGIAALQMLNILEQFDVTASAANSAEFFHLLIESKRIAFEDRAVYYADSDFVKIPIKELISKDYAKARARLIDPRKASKTFVPGRIRNSSETIYLTVADAQGNMVSLIQSLYSPWGSHYVVDGLGFALQNRGALFSLDSSAWNRLEPHKRPFHTIIPAFVTKEDKPVFSFGVTGGDYQPQGQVQILLNIIDHKMSIQEAGDHPRLWHREGFEFTGEKFGSQKVILEPGFPQETRRQLANMGHVIADEVRYFGGYQGIWTTQDPRKYIGASDFRKDGCSFGY